MPADPTAYATWLDTHVIVADPFSAASVRELMKTLIMGRNYRLLTESFTRERLFKTYAWLINTARQAQADFGDDWQAQLFNQLSGMRSESARDLSSWLLGLTRKTADNLDVSAADYPAFLTEASHQCESLLARIGKQEWADDAWLLLMAGSATLSVRGSRKAKIGKGIEKRFLKTALTILGFELSRNFWIGIERDREVGRETDGEIETRRGRVRVEVALIARGNQEVIEDKINRVGRNGIVICDRLGTRSRVIDSARRESVKLIQIRHCEALVELKNYLDPIAQITLNEPPHTEGEADARLAAFSDTFFTIPGAEPPRTHRVVRRRVARGGD